MALETPHKTSPRARYAHHRPQRNLKAVTSSPSWKETLKESCLQRARRKRNEVLNRKRQLNPIARMLVEEELEESGVSIVSDNPDSPSTAEATTESVNDEEYAISEEELYELMQEVEDELQREEAMYAEEFLNTAEYYEQLHQQELEWQIAEFEEWEAINQHNETVPCPICNDEAILEEQDWFVCPNNMQGTCPFKVSKPDINFSLADLKNSLALALETHAAHCFSPIRFVVDKRDESELTTLVALCTDCNTNNQVV